MKAWLGYWWRRLLRWVLFWRLEKRRAPIFSFQWPPIGRARQVLQEGDRIRISCGDLQRLAVVERIEKREDGTTWAILTPILRHGCALKVRIENRVPEEGL